jgi:hypothetical protein
MRPLLRVTSAVKCFGRRLLTWQRRLCMHRLGQVHARLRTLAVAQRTRVVTVRVRTVGRRLQILQIPIHLHCHDVHTGTTPSKPALGPTLPPIQWVP